MSKSKISGTLRDEVKRRADSRCEYCRVPDTMVLIKHHVDHIIPEKQSGKTESQNLAYSCQQCNIHKGASVAAYSKEWKRVIALFHPRIQEWNDHFLLRKNGKIEAKTKEGEGTIKILQINRLDRIARRKLLIQQGLI